MVLVDGGTSAILAVGGAGAILVDRSGSEDSSTRARPPPGVIRYVVAAALVVALLGTASSAVKHGTAVRSETELETAIATVDSTATSLVEHDRPPAARERAPRRLVTIELPDDGVLQSAAEQLAFERVPGTDATRVTYRVAGRTEQTAVIGAPLRRAGDSSFALGGRTGEVTLLLRLVSAESGPVVSVTVDP
jgi:hypothetical protein